MAVRKESGSEIPSDVRLLAARVREVKAALLAEKRALLDRVAAVDASLAEFDGEADEESLGDLIMTLLLGNPGLPAHTIVTSLVAFRVVTPQAVHVAVSRLVAQGKVRGRGPKGNRYYFPAFDAIPEAPRVAGPEGAATWLAVRMVCAETEEEIEAAFAGGNFDEVRAATMAFRGSPELANRAFQSMRKQLLGAVVAKGKAAR